MKLGLGRQLGLAEPANVVIVPVLDVTLRIRLLAVSAMKMLPDVSIATSRGLNIEVLVAATLSRS